jgi:hypothetical protein
MDWIAHARLHGIAKHYAVQLPPYLQQAYLESEFYTRGQIDHAVETLGLPRDYVGLAYAAYLPKPAYDEAHATLPLPMSYEEARAEFFEHLPEPEPVQQWNPLTSAILGRL